MSTLSSMSVRDPVSKNHGGQHLSKAQQVVLSLSHNHICVHSPTHTHPHTHHKERQGLPTMFHHPTCMLKAHEVTRLPFSVVPLRMVCFSSDSPEEMALLAKQGRKSLPWYPVTAMLACRACVWWHSLPCLFVVLGTLPGKARDLGVQRGTGLGWVGVAVWEVGDLVLILL